MAQNAIQYNPTWTTMIFMARMWNVCDTEIIWKSLLKMACLKFMDGNEIHICVTRDYPHVAARRLFESCGLCGISSYTGSSHLLFIIVMTVSRGNIIIIMINISCALFCYTCMSYKKIIMIIKSHISRWSSSPPPMMIKSGVASAQWHNQWAQLEFLY